MLTSRYVRRGLGYEISASRAEPERVVIAERKA
jgi:hypothetical protein